MWKENCVCLCMEKSSTKFPLTIWSFSFLRLTNGKWCFSNYGNPSCSWYLMLINLWIDLEVGVEDSSILNRTINKLALFKSFSLETRASSTATARTITITWLYGINNSNSILRPDLTAIYCWSSEIPCRMKDMPNMESESLSVKTLSIYSWLKSKFKMNGLYCKKNLWN